MTKRRWLRVSCGAALVLSVSTGCNTCDGEVPQVEPSSQTMIDAGAEPDLGSATEMGPIEADQGTPVDREDMVVSVGEDMDAQDADMAEEDMTTAVPDPVPTGLSISSGGGRARSTNFGAWIQVGQPQPMGTSSSPNYRLRLAPVVPRQR